jgi:hypothetical protein
MWSASVGAFDVTGPDDRFEVLLKRFWHHVVAAVGHPVERGQQGESPEERSEHHRFHGSRLRREESVSYQ